MQIQDIIQAALAGAPPPGTVVAGESPASSPTDRFAGLIDPTLQGGEGEIPCPPSPSLTDFEAEGVEETARREESSRRRRRSNSAEAALEATREEDRRARLLLFAEESMNRHQLEGIEARNHIRQMSQLSLREQLVELLVIYSKKQVDLEATAARTFIRSQVFTSHVINCLKVALLAPFLMSYVTRLQEWILKDIQEHPQAWKVPDNIINDATQWNEFASAIKTKLTQLRATWKNLIQKMNEDGFDINKIMLKLAPPQMVISENHRARWAFICQCFSEFETLVEEGTETPNRFWMFIDAKLKSVKIQAFANARSNEHAQQLMQNVFVHALAQHRLDHPTESSVGPIGDRPVWQATVETVMDFGTAV